VEFLILAVVLIVIGVVIVILRNRRPTGIDAGIADFEARRQALAPTEPEEREQDPRSRRSG
jgi:hypothetical protein